MCSTSSRSPYRRSTLATAERDMNLIELLESDNSKFPEIEFVRGCLYLNGLGVEEDISKALSCFQKACDGGVVIANYSVAMLLLRNGDDADNIRKAIEHLCIAADNNFIPALLNLSMFYEFGRFVRADSKKSFEYNLRAAELGCDSAITAVAQQFEYGFDDQKSDMQLALKWYLRAAESGNAVAQERLADIYKNGELGVVKDVAIAAKWIRSARELVTRQQSETLAKYRAAAQNGHKGSQKVLSEIYRLGEYGVEIDSNKSAYWLTKFIGKSEANQD